MFFSIPPSQGGEGNKPSILGDSSQSPKTGKILSNDSLNERSDTDFASILEDEINKDNKTATDGENLDLLSSLLFKQINILSEFKEIYGQNSDNINSLTPKTQLNSLLTNRNEIITAKTENTSNEIPKDANNNLENLILNDGLINADKSINFNADLKNISALIKKQTNSTNQQNNEELINIQKESNIEVNELSIDQQNKNFAQQYTEQKKIDFQKIIENPDNNLLGKNLDKSNLLKALINQEGKESFIDQNRVKSNNQEINFIEINKNYENKQNINQILENKSIQDINIKNSIKDEIFNTNKIEDILIKNDLISKSAIQTENLLNEENLENIIDKNLQDKIENKEGFSESLHLFGHNGESIFKVENDSDSSPSTSQSISPESVITKTIDLTDKLKATQGGVAKLELQDDSFGKVNLQIDMKNSENVHIFIQTEHDDLKKKIEEKIDSLKQSLETQKINLVDVKVSSIDKNSSSQFSNSNQQGQNQSQNHKPENQNVFSMQNFLSNDQNKNFKQEFQNNHPSSNENIYYGRKNAFKSKQKTPVTNIQRSANGSIKVMA